LNYYDESQIPNDWRTYASFGLFLYNAPPFILLILFVVSRLLWDTYDPFDSGFGFMLGWWLLFGLIGSAVGVALGLRARPCRKLTDFSIFGNEFCVLCAVIIIAASCCVRH
jgi:hypothetical protein